MQDPLNVQVETQGVDTSLPLFPETDYPLLCVESQFKLNKAGEGLNWELVFETEREYTAIDGRNIKAKFPFYLVLALQPAPDSKDPEAFRRNLGEAQDALFHTNKNNRPPVNKALADAAVGRRVVGGVYTDDYKGVLKSKLKRIKKLDASA